MKRLFVLIAVSLLSAGLYAQKDVTKFLGIEVDGTRASFIQKLRAKGFTVNRYKDDILDGEFNGEKVNIAIFEQGNKVWKVLVGDVAMRNETQIKMRFNDLVSQFESNPNYYPPSNDQRIAEDEDLGYGISILERAYQAFFIQRGNVESDKKLVWIEIMRANTNEYYIVIFYENGYNKIDGRDL